MWTPEQLITLISESSWGVPVRDMEALLSLGKESATSIIGFLKKQDLQDPGDVELLWPVVSLGELRAPEAVPMLIRILSKSPGLELAVAAAEALSKGGKAALCVLERLMEEAPDPRTRILGYAALSRLNLTKAWQILEAALKTDAEMDFVVARGLAERNHPADLERVHGAYVRSEPWKRSAFEETLMGMISGRLPWAEGHRDWRLRYRRQPRQGLQIPLTWPGVMFLMWQSRHELRPPADARTLSLDQLVERAGLDAPGMHCESCGLALRSPTGIALCNEVEEDIISYQLDHIQHWRANGWEDIHEVLDELDHKEMEVLQWPEERNEERIRKGEALDAVDVVKRTLSWMVEEGFRELSEGEKRLEEALERARIQGP